jgi:hypothetical protein
MWWETTTVEAWGREAARILSSQLELSMLTRHRPGPSWVLTLLGGSPYPKGIFWGAVSLPSQGWLVEPSRASLSGCSPLSWWQGEVERECAYPLRFLSLLFSLFPCTTGIGIYQFYSNPSGGRPWETREKEGGVVISASEKAFPLHCEW